MKSRNLLVFALLVSIFLFADEEPSLNGVVSLTVVPASSRPLDTRLEIEIPNLLVNGYFREGEGLPPRGWFTYGGEKYGKSRHDARSIRLEGDSAKKTLALRQNGLILLPGETYRLSGYVRGGGFDGAMKGHIGVASANWSKTRAYFYTAKDIKEDWQYFELVFSPDTSKSGEYESVVYRTGAGGGFMEVERLILEPLSELAKAKSRNRYAEDTFDENYACAKAAGTFRSGPSSPEYKLVWQDEFDGPAIDESKWKIYDMYRNVSTRPYRLVPDCLSFDGEGHLLLTTRLAADGKVEQPRISSTGKKPFIRGYVECRFQLHDSDLVNASFWMLPEGHMDARDPVNKGLEIDIMECILPTLETMSQTTHWYSTDPITKEKLSFSGGTRARRAPGLSQGWHTVALEWTKTDLIFFINGVESWRLNEKEHPIPVNEHNIIFSFGAKNADVQALPNFSTTWKVDYVRLYQKPDDN